MLPIFDHRIVIGYAKTEKQAEKLVKSKLQNIPKNWKVSVKQRDTEIINLPIGWVYSVHP